MQSAYRPHHSAETALVKVCNDLLCSLDKRKAFILVLLDMSAAFDTIDHGIMLSRLNDRFGISGTALKWFESYMENHSQNIQMHDTISEEQAVAFGVPQGSVLGPLLFISYTAPLCDIARRHGISIHLYADDTQLYISFSLLSNEDTTNSAMIVCDNAAIKRCPAQYRKKKKKMMRQQAFVVDIHNWMIANKLKLNADKIDAICSPRIKNNIDMPRIELGNMTVPTSIVAKKIGVFFDHALTMKNHVQHVSCGIFLHSLHRQNQTPARSKNHGNNGKRLHHFATRSRKWPTVRSIRPSTNTTPESANSASRLVTQTKRREHISLL